MENKKAKPAASKSRVGRTVSDSATKVSSQRSSVKPKPSSNQQSSASHGKKPVGADQKHGVKVSRPASTTATEPEERENESWATMPNTPFPVLVQVLLAATKWLKISKKVAARRRPLSKSLSLPPPPLRPV